MAGQVVVEEEVATFPTRDTSGEGRKVASEAATVGGVMGEEGLRAEALLVASLAAVELAEEEMAVEAVEGVVMVLGMEGAREVVVMAVEAGAVAWEGG